MAEHPALTRIRRIAERHNPGKDISLAGIEKVDTNLLDAYISGERVTVRTDYHNGESFVRKGRVSVTLGWKPVLVLMHRRGSRGSSDTLGNSDRVI